MTREEALNKAIGVLTYHQVNFCKSKEAVANMNEIIEVLEKIDQEPCEDAISRQAVLEAIDVKAWEFCDYLISKGRNDEQKPVSHFADNLRECVGEDLPSVTAQRKVGHWEWVQYDSNPNIGNWHCSECRTIVPRIPEVDNTPIYKWCPMCGAKMSEIPTVAEGSDKE